MPKLTEEQRAAAAAERKRRADYKQAFSTAAGKRVLTDLMLQAGMLSELGGSRQNPLSSTEALVRSGERRVALRIMDLVFVDNEKKMEALQEALNKKHARRQ